MSTSAMVFMIFSMTVLWGGLAFFLGIAIKKMSAANKAAKNTENS